MTAGGRATGEVADRAGLGSAPGGTDEPTLVERMGQFAMAYVRWIEAHTEGGLSYPRLRLLGLLHCGGPAIMRVLADQLGLTPRNMTALVDGLEAEGLVRRRMHPTDRRAVLVEATPAGLELAECSLRPRLDAIGSIFEALTPAEREHLADMVTRVSAEMRRRSEALSTPKGSARAAR